MAPIPFMPLQQHVISQLKRYLPATLTYHSTAHTQDVLKQALKIATHEGVTSPGDLFLLKVAALYHDTGYLHSYHNHEALGCGIAWQELPGFGLSPAQIEVVCGMIKATKIPQSPETLLEKILCDADLDYLGRDDFREIAYSLFLELKHYNRIPSEEDWNLLQIEFLEKHQYFTDYALHHREPVKQAHLQALKTIVSQVL